MNPHYHSLPGKMNTVRAQRAHGLACPDGRTVSALRFGGWLADGFAIMRSQPLLWLTAILACADFATLLELAPPLLYLAPFAVPAVFGALMLMQERARNARPWTLAETFAAIGGHRNALFTIGIAGAAIAGVGYLVPFVAFHVTMASSVAANGAHSLSIVYGAQNGGTNPLEPLLGLPFYAIALAATWFAPALVVLHNQSAAHAMTASLHAMWRNRTVALVYLAAIAADVLLVPVLPMLVRGLVVTPLVSALIVTSMYGCFRDVFGQRS